MKAKEIRDLIDFISNSGLDEVNIETQEFKISVKKNTPVVATTVDASAAIAPVVQAVEVPAAATAISAAPSGSAAPVSSAAPEAQNNYIEIKSPMIGTFYNTPNPESDPFVNEGDAVKWDRLYVS